MMPRPARPRPGYSPARRLGMVVFGVIWLVVGSATLVGCHHHDQRFPGRLSRGERGIRSGIALATLAGLRLVYTGLTPRRRTDDFDDPEYPDVYRPD